MLVAPVSFALWPFPITPRIFNKGHLNTISYRFLVKHNDINNNWSSLTRQDAILIDEYSKSSMISIITVSTWLVIPLIWSNHHQPLAINSNELRWPTSVNTTVLQTTAVLVAEPQVHSSFHGRDHPTLNSCNWFYPPSLVPDCYVQLRQPLWVPVGCKKQPWSNKHDQSLSTTKSISGSLTNPKSISGSLTNINNQWSTIINHF